MNDRDFLIFIHERLVLFGDSPCIDFLHKLRCIIKETPKDKITLNRSKWNDIEELLRDLNEHS